MKAQSIIGQVRYACIRGYNKEVKVINQKGDNLVCQVISSGRTEIVPEHLFYHRENGQQLVLRGGVEFMRKWPNHALEIETVSI